LSTAPSVKRIKLTVPKPTKPQSIELNSPTTSISLSLPSSGSSQTSSPVRQPSKHQQRPDTHTADTTTNNNDTNNDFSEIDDLELDEAIDDIVSPEMDRGSQTSGISSSSGSGLSASVLPAVSSSQARTSVDVKRADEFEEEIDALLDDEVERAFEDDGKSALT
jgi:hypothetical protein